MSATQNVQVHPNLDHNRGRHLQHRQRLTGYHPGVKMQYLCHEGLLTLIGRTKPGHSWNSRTVLIRGAIVALNPGSITLSDTDATTTTSPAPKQTCKLTSASPSPTSTAVASKSRSTAPGARSPALTTPTRLLAQPRNRNPLPTSLAALIALRQKERTPPPRQPMPEQLAKKEPHRPCPHRVGD